MDLNNFDANQVEPSQTFDLMKEGWYEAIISESEEKLTKAKDRGLNLTFTITQEPYQNRLIWEFLNINHSTSEQAKQIARGQLSAICRAVGVLTPKDSTSLHNLPLLIKIGTETRQDNGELKNVIKGYKPRMAAVAKEQTVPTQQAAPSLAQAAGAAPWSRVK